MSGTEVLRYAAFTRPRPAATRRGWCWTPRAGRRRRCSRSRPRSGYSETAFSSPRGRGRPRRPVLQPVGRGAVLRPRHHGHGGRAGRAVGPGASPPHAGPAGRGRRTAADGRSRRPSPACRRTWRRDAAELEKALAALRLPRTSSTRRSRPPRTPAQPPGAGRRTAAAGDLDYDFERGARSWAPRPDHGPAGLAESPDLSTPATRSRSAAWSRTRRPEPPRPRSAATCATSASSSPAAVLDPAPGRRMGRPAP